MNEIQTIVVGLLNTPPFNKRFAQIRRVFAVKGIAPTCDTCGGDCLKTHSGQNVS